MEVVLKNDYLNFFYVNLKMNQFNVCINYIIYIKQILNLY